jgi:hypothetical protein
MTARRAVVVWPAKTPRVRQRAGEPPAVDARAARYLRVVAALCADRGWPVPVAEYRFNAERRWRFDLCWPDHWIAVEVEGGLFSGGRHVRGASLRREYAKLNDAQIRGWIVLMILPEQITNGTLSDLLAAYFARWYPVAFPVPVD